jgi:hypothetical protein
MKISPPISVKNVIITENVNILKGRESLRKRINPTIETTASIITYIVVNLNISFQLVTVLVMKGVHLI